MKFLNNLKLKWKLPLVIVALGVVTALVTAAVSYQTSRNQLVAAAESRLTAMTTARAYELKRELESIRTDLITFARNPEIKKAIQHFSSVWKTMEAEGVEMTSVLKQAYINQNPYPVGEKHKLDYAMDGSKYSQAHAVYHGFFREFLELRGYYDIFLFDNDGNLIYSVFKEADFATNFVDGEWSGTDLGAAFRAARNLGATDPSAFLDFAPYEPSYGAPASFISRAVFNANGERIGVVAFQMPIGQINAIMTHPEGLGETGESFLVGGDRLMRSDSRFEGESVILKEKYNSPVISGAFEGQSGVGYGVDHDGVTPVLEAFMPVEFLGTTWAVVAHQETGEILAPVRQLRNRILLQLAISAVAITLVGGWIAHTLSKPLTRVSTSMAQVAGGDYHAEIAGTDRKDEVGDIAETLEKFRGKLAAAEIAAKEANLKSQAFIGSSSAMLIIDRDFNILFVNKSARDLFKRQLSVLKTRWPAFDPDNLVGNNIDMFHENPAHQRQMLRDPSRLPMTSEIIIDDIRISLDVSAVYDDTGTYVGNILQWNDITEESQNGAILDAIDKHQGVIEFTLDGHIIDANENLQKVMGYSLDEIRGRHHSMFVSPEMRGNREYREHWERLRKGETLSGKFRRRSSSGKEIWLNGAYNVLFDKDGKPYKIVKIVSDITEMETIAFEKNAILEAIGRSQTMAEYKVDGQILWANDRFRELLGYSEQELKGKHHSMLVDDAERRSESYRDFWNKLGRGEPVAGVFPRLGRDGKLIYLLASYNAVLNRDGEIEKIVEYASDHTSSEMARLRAEEQANHMEAEKAKVVDALSVGLRHLSDGDLTFRVQHVFPPEYEQLKLDFNSAGDKMQSTMHSIISSTSSIRRGSTEINQAADDLARRTENQAATLEEAAAALEQLTASVKMAAEGAERANSEVGEAKHNAEESGIVVKDAVNAMSEIEKSSEQISQIIGVIDDIAFQTNLLALNAGVEAARAGEAGRGFAVVASEVRALAQRSSDAAKEIKTLISASSGQVERGVDLVGQTGRALNEIVTSVGSISRLVSDIAGSAKEQATGLAEVNVAVSQLDQVTQQNAAMVEESTAASHSLSKEADDLGRLIARFKADKDGGGYQETHAPARQTSSRNSKAGYAGSSRSNLAHAPAEEAHDDWQDF